MTSIILFKEIVHENCSYESLLEVHASSIERSVKRGLEIITLNRVSVGGFQALIKMDSKNASTVLASIDINSLLS